MAQPTLETERLILRPLTSDDAGNVQRYAGEADVALGKPDIPYPYLDGLAEQWIATHPTLFETKDQIIFGIAWNSEPGSVIGCIGFILDSQHKDIAKIGYWVAKPFWGKGIVTEAGKRLLRYGFEELKLHVVSGNHFSSNPASGRVMIKLGMTYEGRLRRRAKRDSKFEDLEYYSILAEEYLKGNDS